MGGSSCPRARRSRALAVYIDGGQLDQTALVQQGHGALEQMAVELYLLASEPKWRLISEPIDLDDMIQGYPAALVQHEGLAQLLGVLVKAQGARILVETLPRGRAVQGLVGRVVVALLQKMAQAQLQGLDIRIDLGIARQQAQQLFQDGPVEAFDLAMSLRIPGAAVDQVNPRACARPRWRPGR